MSASTAYPPPGPPLNGYISDVTDMAKFLVNRCGFASSDIRLLTDQRATKTGIIERLGWLANGLREGDRIIFHYNGHGAQMPTRNPQGEVDKLEVICPVDFDWFDAHAIRDKEFHNIFASIPAGVDFVWINVRQALKNSGYGQQPQLEGSPDLMSKPFLTVKKAAHRASSAL